MTETLPMNNIYNMNCIDGMKLLKDESVNTIIADPPFCLNFKSEKANYNRKQSNVLKSYQDVKHDDYYSFNEEWMEQAKRILKKDGSLFIFSGWNNLIDILNVGEKLNLIQYNHVIWKYGFGVFAKNSFISSHYHIICYSKTKKHKHFPYARFSKNEVDEEGRKKYYIDREDVWIINREYWNGYIKSPTKLPAEVLEKLIVYSTEENDMIVDAFAGSGQVGWLCKHKLNRNHIAFEKEKDIYEFAKQRLDSGQYLIKASSITTT